MAQVAELVDALASGASDRKVVGVRVPSWAPTKAFFINSRKKPRFEAILKILLMGFPKTYN